MNMTHITETKKPKRLRTWLIIAAVLVIILWIIGTVTGTDETSTEADPEPTQTEQAETPEAEPEPEPSETEEPEPEPTEAQEPEPKPSKAEQRAEKPSPTERRETDNGLDPVHAQVACTQQAEAEAYPDNIKVHTVMGKIQEVINEDEIRFLWEATLSSSAGGELRGELLCIATGTNDSPTVELEFR